MTKLWFIVKTSETNGQMRLQVVTDEHGNTRYFHSRPEADEWALAHIDVYTEDWIICAW